MTGTVDSPPPPTRPREGLVKASGTYGSAALAAALVGVLRSKATALELGPDGVGTLAQLSLITVLAGAVCSAGLGNVAVKVLAQARAEGDDEAERRVRSLVLLLPLAASMAVLVLALPFRAPVAGLLLGDRGLGDALAVSLLSVPLNMLFMSYGILLQSRHDIARLGITNFLSSLIATVVSISLVLGLGFRGGVLAIVASGAVPLSVALVRHRGLLRGVRLRCVPTRRERQALGGLALASLVVNVLLQGGETVTRAAVLRVVDADALGQHQPASLLHLQLFLPLVSGVTVFLLPRLTALGATDRGAVGGQVQRALRLVLLLLVGLSLLLLAFRRLFVVVVFSDEFTQAPGLLLVQVPAELLFAAAYVIGAPLIPLDRWRAWFVLAVSTIGVQTALAVLLVPVLGVRALPLAFAVAWGCSLAATLVVVWATGLLPALDSRLLVAGLTLVLAASAGIRVFGLAGEVLAGAAALVWLYAAPSSAERGRVTATIRSRVPGLRR